MIIILMPTRNTSCMQIYSSPEDIIFACNNKIIIACYILILNNYLSTKEDKMTKLGPNILIEYFTMLEMMQH